MARLHRDWEERVSDDRLRTVLVVAIGLWAAPVVV
jgi:hypothetical protein